MFRRTSSPNRAFADMHVGNDSVSRFADLCFNEAYHEKGPHATLVPRSEVQHHQPVHSPGKVLIFFWLSYATLCEWFCATPVL